jgi:phage terminase large subunit-like protein
MDPVKVRFEVGDEHLALWEQMDWRYAFLMGGRGNGRSGTSSRYVTSRVLGKEYTRGAVMRAVKEDSVAQLSYLLSGIDWRMPQATWRPQASG